MTGNVPCECPNLATYAGTEPTVRDPVSGWPADTMNFRSVTAALYPTAVPNARSWNLMSFDPSPLTRCQWCSQQSGSGLGGCAMGSRVPSDPRRPNWKDF